MMNWIENCSPRDWRCLDRVDLIIISSPTCGQRRCGRVKMWQIRRCCRDYHVELQLSQWMMNRGVYLFIAWMDGWRLKSVFDIRFQWVSVSQSVYLHLPLSPHWRRQTICRSLKVQQQNKLWKVKERNVCFAPQVDHHPHIALNFCFFYVALSIYDTVTSRRVSPWN